MLFNSLAFMLFLPSVLVTYFLVPRRFRNSVLLFASYFFYGCWDWRFLSLLMISTVVDFECARRMHQSRDDGYRRRCLGLSLLVNLGFLGVFKYFNFFAENLLVLARNCGIDVNLTAIHVILPVGISFYTFQTLSYTIDVYRRDLEPTKNFWEFALYVAYFPQLVAGPIERATQLLPQLVSTRGINRQQWIDGFGLIATGFFKKIVIADRCALLVNAAFSSQALPYPGVQNWLFVYCFAFQIYGDFSGYSDIARGVSKLFGIELMLNFARPYWTTNPAQFWRNWHISLSTWLRDYLYIPLGGNRNGVPSMYRNLMTTMVLGGIWHGAGWAFFFWGIYQGLLLVLHRLLGGAQKSASGIVFLLKVVFFFHVMGIGWLLFRCGALAPEVDALSFLAITLKSLVTWEWVVTEPGVVRTVVLLGIATFLLQWYYKSFEEFHQWTTTGRVVWLTFVFVCIAVFGVFKGAEFIYFQF